MRYQVIVSLDGDEIPKDKNRMFPHRLRARDGPLRNR